MKNLEKTKAGKEVIKHLQNWYNLTKEQSTRCLIHLIKKDNIETEQELGSMRVAENDVLVWVDNNRETTYTWAQINQTLMNKGYSPARIGDILIELTKVTKK